MRHKNAWLVVVVVSVCFSAIAVYLITHYTLTVGDVFFGKVDYFYNPKIARAFYAHAIERAKSRHEAPPRFAYYQLSRTYFIDGDFSEALRYAQEELVSHPDNWRTYYILGLTLGYMDREEEAIEAFSTFLKHKPESWAARNDKAWLHFRIGDIEGGIDTIIPAAQDNPQNPWVMNTYGVLLMNQGLFEQAKQAFVQAQAGADSMNEAMWGKAYPGNSPQIYGEGLAAMRLSIQKNLDLVTMKSSGEAGDN